LDALLLPLLLLLVACPPRSAWLSRGCPGAPSQARHWASPGRYLARQAFFPHLLFCAPAWAPSTHLVSALLSDTPAILSSRRPAVGSLRSSIFAPRRASSWCRCLSSRLLTPLGLLRPSPSCHGEQTWRGPVLGTDFWVFLDPLPSPFMVNLGLCKLLFLGDTGFPLLFVLVEPLGFELDILW